MEGNNIADWLKAFEAAEDAYEDAFSEEDWDYSDEGEAAYRDAMIELAQSARRIFANVAVGTVR